MLTVESTASAMSKKSVVDIAAMYFATGDAQDLNILNNLRVLQPRWNSAFPECHYEFKKLIESGPDFTSNQLRLIHDLCQQIEVYRRKSVQKIDQDIYELLSPNNRQISKASKTLLNSLNAQLNEKSITDLDEACRRLWEDAIVKAKTIVVLKELEREMECTSIEALIVDLFPIPDPFLPANLLKIGYIKQPTEQIRLDNLTRRDQLLKLLELIDDQLTTNSFDTEPTLRDVLEVIEENHPNEYDAVLDCVDIHQECWNFINKVEQFMFTLIDIRKQFNNILKENNQ